MAIDERDVEERHQDRRRAEKEERSAVRYSQSIVTYMSVLSVTTGGANDMTTLQNACNAITTLVNSTIITRARQAVNCQHRSNAVRRKCERDTHLLGLLCDESAVDMGVMFLASAANW